MAKPRKKTGKSAKKKESLPLVHPNAAGIDIASEEYWVCVPADRAQEPIRKFGAFTCDLYAIADWLRECGIETVAMESTGVYRVPLFQILEQRGFEVCPDNAAHVKNVPGRTKTDRIDCQWLRKLHSFGLLSASFRPEDEICQLRALLRHRGNLIRLSVMHVQHAQKSLHQMNLLLDKVVSDITGVTGMKIIGAILRGERDPVRLAQLRDCRIRAGEEEIAKALEGDYRAEHLFTLRQAVQAYRYTRSQILRCDDEVETLLRKLRRKVDARTDPPPPATDKKKPRSDEPGFDIRTYLYEILGVDATRIPGFQILTVQTLVSEVGADMSRWKTPGHFASWLCLCPDPQKSGGKTIRNRRTRRTRNRAAQALRQGAMSLLHSSTRLGAFYRRMRTRPGAAKAITATAHKMALIYYHMVRNGTEYRELGEDYYSRHHRARTLRRLRRQAEEMGYDLVAQQQAG